MSGLTAENEGIISQCYFVGTVTGTYRIGALAGNNQGIITNCYAQGEISGSNTAGGLAGENRGIITSSYAAVQVNTSDLKRVGGLVGDNHLNTIVNCYYLDSTDYNVPENSIGTALTEQEMMQRENFIHWDFYGTGDNKRNIWFIPENSYPILTWQTDQTGLIQLPYVKGDTLEETTKTIVNVGLFVGETYFDYDLTVPAGKVIRLEPIYPVPIGAKVDVWISLGAYDWQDNPGVGTWDSPFQIQNAGQFDSLTQFPDLWFSHFVLTDDIKMSGYIYLDSPLASDANWDNNEFHGVPFSGTFNGQDHSIFGLTILSTKKYIGLCGGLDTTGRIHNLNLENGCIISSHLGIQGTGELAGINTGTIENCHATGKIAGFGPVGGLVGQNYGEVTRSSYKGSVIGTSDIGGLVGINDHITSLCYSDSDTYCWNDSGGLVGLNRGEISDCYSAGKVQGNHDIGGLVGINSNPGLITTCYTSVIITDTSELQPNSRLVGNTQRGTIYNSYFLDLNTGTDLSTVPGIPLTSSRMKQQDSFIDWDFYGRNYDGHQDNWFMPEDSFPIFAWQIEETGLYLVPSVIGLTVDAAQSQLESSGFTSIQIEYDYDQSVPIGQVMAQPYTAFSLQDGVSLIISAGPYDWSDNPGDGSSNNPYQINSPGQLDALSWYPELWDKHFVLMLDINMSDRSYSNALIGKDEDFDEWRFQGTPFTGTFDGQGHVITGLTALSDGEFMGLFGKIEADGVVRNLGLEDVRVRGHVWEIIRECGTGGLAGENWGHISRCYVIGTITGTEEVGGLVGHNVGIITDCFAEGSIDGTKILGGLVGFNLGEIVNCYADVDVTGQYSSMGGLVGTHYDGRILNCYATSHLHYETGFISRGGLVGAGPENVILCFWDMETSGASESYGGFGRTTDRMKDITTFIGWGDGHWTIKDGEDYPRLAWEKTGGIPIENIPYRTYSGTGDPNDPFVLVDAQDILCLMSRSQDWIACFELGDHIDMNDIEGYLPPTAFSGTFHGNDYEISNLSITENTYALGLFGYSNEGFISHLGLIDVQITNLADLTGAIAGYNTGVIESCWTSGNLSGQSYVGGLVGFNNGSIHDCHALVNIQSDDIAGGLIGYSQRYNTITKSYAIADVNAHRIAGGLVGIHAGQLNNCYALGNVSSSAAGGLVGISSGGNITDCYSKANVFGRVTSSVTGGLVGTNDNTHILNCFSAGRIFNGTVKGGLVGKGNRLYVYSSFWDKETTGLTDSAGGIGCTTFNMMRPDKYSLNGWANDPNWILDEEVDYPHLAWEGTTGKPILSPILDWIEGSGTESNPFNLINLDQFVKISNASIFWDQHITLGADIELYETTWNQSVIPRFRGVLDGNHHVIRKLTINGDGYLGLIGRLESDALVKNLIIEEANVVGTEDYVGVLVGQSYGNMDNCYSHGTVNGAQWVGGLVGQLNNGIVMNSSSNNVVSGSSYTGGLLGANIEGDVTNSYSISMIHGWSNVGGLVGRLSGGNITKCYSVSTISGNSDVGGLVGQSSGHVSQSYCHGEVTGNRVVGGLVGYNHWGDIDYCYSTCTVSGNQSVAGFVGENSSSTISNSFWDVIASNINIGYNLIQYYPGPGTVTNVQGLPTAQMQTAQPYLDAGWDFDTIWSICEGKDYPRLQWEGVVCE